MRIWPLIALGVFAGIAGGISARLFSGGSMHWPELPAQLILNPREEPPPQPPSRDEIARFVPDQRAELIRENGDPIAVEYSSVILDPRWIDLEFFGGWNREFEANEDSEALLFFTGPTFEKQFGRGDLDMALHGDLMLSNGTWRAGNRAAAAGRAYIAVSENGNLEFGYGDLTPSREERFRLFIGGLHAFSHKDQIPPSSYRGVYGEMRLADVRIVYALRSDGALELIETADGVHFNDLKLLVEQRNFKAAFLPDHASKSRLIVPGLRPWSEEQAIWVSGGKPSITQLPFMLRVLARDALPQVQ